MLLPVRRHPPRPRAPGGRARWPWTSEVIPSRRFPHWLTVHPLGVTAASVLQTRPIVPSGAKRVIDSRSDVRGERDRADEEARRPGLLERQQDPALRRDERDPHAYDEGQPGPPGQALRRGGRRDHEREDEQDADDLDRLGSCQREQEEDPD